ALFTGQELPTYAPELHLAGVAAGGPVPDIQALVKANLSTLPGRIFIARPVDPWRKAFPTRPLAQWLRPAATPLVKEAAGTCPAKTLTLLASVPAAVALELTFVSKPPWEVEPWASVMVANDPGGSSTPAPVLVVQGQADTIVLPPVTDAL